MSPDTQEAAVRRPTPAAGDEAWMQLALEAARRAGLAGEPPIGACLVRAGQVLGTASNCVVSELDITAHAEITLIRDACRRGRTLDLSGCELYSTVEPCPMCLAACQYAGIGRIVYGATLTDLQAFTGNEMLRAPGVAGQHGPKLQGGCLRRECLALLESWAGGRR
jgi:tRNA(adenine34) deaminase